MKKLRYESEDLGGKTFAILSIFMLIVLLINNFIENSVENLYIIIFYGIGCVFCGLIFLKGIIHRIQCKKIIKYGVRVDGTILGLKTDVNSSPSGSSPTDYDHTFENKLFIQYTIPESNKTNVILTETLNFNPKFNLGSRKCSVYILNDEIYVTDFIERKKGQPNIWINES